MISARHSSPVQTAQTTHVVGATFSAPIRKKEKYMQTLSVRNRKAGIYRECELLQRPSAYVQCSAYFHV